MNRVVIIAGEASGDAIGEGLVQQIKQHYPNCDVVGMAGPKMMSHGMTAWYHIDDLSVMGVSEVLKCLPRILKMRKALIQKILDFKPDLVIGIDAPDFNLNIEKKCKAAGIKTVHYVSPSIWAWKPWRIHGIKKATDLVLCTLPFEVPIYEKHQHPAAFVGHPLADRMDFSKGKVDYCHELGLDPTKCYVALLPGSRSAELKKLLPIFLETATQFQKTHPHVHFLLPVARESLRAQLEAQQAEFDDLDLKLVDGKAQTVLGASSAALLASGTIALEAALLNVPSVMAYQVSALTYAIGRTLIRLKYFTLPNIILNECLIPELIQSNATVENCLSALNEQFQKGNEAIDPRVQRLRDMLKREASEMAFQEVQKLCQ